MRKVKSTRRKPAAKPKSASKTVEEYVAAVPAASRGTFNKLRVAVQSAVPRDAVETISYQIPAFKQKVLLIWFAAFTNHCSLFPTSSVIEDFKAELKGFSTSKGTIHFPLDKPLPRALVKRIVKARVAQVEGKKRR
jgi:uncharacterized protein YdhG (YjbR/CyaY superfamily)